jgi:hypothetical protein
LLVSNEVKGVQFFDDEGVIDWKNEPLAVCFEPYRLHGGVLSVGVLLVEAGVPEGTFTYKGKTFSLPDITLERAEAKLYQDITLKEV